VEHVLALLAGVSLAIWLYLIGFRGGFWRCAQRLDEAPPAPARWPAVAAVIPARNEAALIEESLAAVLAQDYPGEFRIVLVDDHSEDGTADAARGAAQGEANSLTVMAAPDLPPGWKGKLWALHNGMAQAEGAEFFWFTDADIVHAPNVLARLVAKAEQEQLDLVSVMAWLSRRGAWASLLIPPFVFFFQKLYPFAWSNDPVKRTAAAAGGCALVRAETLRAAGGLLPIRNALIDDCALGREIKTVARGRGHATWLGLSRDVRSIRPYRSLGEVWRMVARSAYTQLRHSPLLLIGTLLGMAITYLVPPLAVLAWPWHDDALAGALALAAWGLMAVAVWPTLRLYDRPVWQAPLLPLAALLYSAMTVDSALSHWRGRGGAWKGRTAARGRETVAGPASGG